MTTPLANIGIISIGDMGVGIARLLLAHNFRVLTNVTDRSQATQTRAQKANIELLQTDGDLVEQSDYILSIVPPRDSRATADRIIAAHNKLSTRTASNPLYFLDLNAIAPSTARLVAQAFAERAKEIRVVDGGIIGGPPKAKPCSDDSGMQEWDRPSICLSGPYPLASAPKYGAKLAEILNTKHVSDEIGTASGLKCCFASLFKGATALAVQSYTTAAQLGVLGDLQGYVGDRAPARLDETTKGLTSFPPKAGRWVEEMREIGKTFSEDGGWGEANIFGQVAEVFDFVAESTPLGKEHVDTRVRGKTVDDVVAAIEEGMEGKKKKKPSNGS